MWHSFVALFVVLTVGLTAPANAKDRISPLLAYIDRDLLSWVGDARLKEALGDAKVSWPDDGGSTKIKVMLARSVSDQDRSRIRAVQDLLSQRVRESDGRIIYAALFNPAQELIAASNQLHMEKAPYDKVLRMPMNGPGDRFLDGEKLAAIPVSNGDTLSLRLSSSLDHRFLGTLRVALKR